MQSLEISFLIDLISITRRWGVGLTYFLLLSIGEIPSHIQLPLRLNITGTLSLKLRSDLNDEKELKNLLCKVEEK